MKLLHYLQQQHGLSRRAITEAIKRGQVFVDKKAIEWFGTEIRDGQFLEAKVGDGHVHQRIKLSDHISELALFHKEAWYVCSKQDEHNYTLYDVLPDRYKNFYYIGRLDKDSRWLVLLTNDSVLVNDYEHPSKKIEKEYIVTVRIQDFGFLERLIAWSFEKSKAASEDEKSDESRSKKPRRSAPSLKKYTQNLETLFRKWLLVDENWLLARKAQRDTDLLRVVSLSMVTEFDDQLRSFNIGRPQGTKTLVLRIILNEGKKRHIRRLLKSIGGDVVDLVRIRIGDYSLDNVPRWKVQPV